MLRTLTWPLWWLATALTIALGGLVSWLPTGTAIFDAVDAGDYMRAAGGYAATTVVLLATATALEAFHGPRNARRVAVGFAALFSFLALRAAILLNHAPVGPGIHSAWTGVHDTLLLPWTEALLVLGVLGWLRLVIEARRGRLTTTRTPLADPQPTSAAA